MRSKGQLGHGEAGFPDELSGASGASLGRRREPATRPKAVVIASSNDILRGRLAGQLRLTAEFSPVEASDCDAALHLLRAETPVAIFVDFNLHELGGHEFCRMVRRYHSSLPIMLLSERAPSDSAEILGLEAGADHVIAGNVSVGLLLALLRARLRDFSRSEAALFEVGPYRFEPAKRSLTDRESRRRVHLTPKEVAILKYLCRHAETIVSRDVLLRDVWYVSTEIDTHTVENHVYRLRRKIERDPNEPEILITEASGYRLVPGHGGSAATRWAILRRA